MSWNTLLIDAGLSEREAEAVIVLSSKPNLKASELAKVLGTTRLDAVSYTHLTLPTICSV